MIIEKSKICCDFGLYHKLHEYVHCNIRNNTNNNNNNVSAMIESSRIWRKCEKKETYTTNLIIVFARAIQRFLQHSDGFRPLANGVIIRQGKNIITIIVCWEQEKTETEKRKCKKMCVLYRKRMIFPSYNVFSHVWYYRFLFSLDIFFLLLLY